MQLETIPRVRRGPNWQEHQPEASFAGCETGNQRCGTRSKDAVERSLCLPDVSAISFGFVPSLEAMPLLCGDASVSDEMRRWRFMAFPSYGRILRNLLAGELVAGLLPWELFVTEVLVRPGQSERWTVPLIIKTRPTELVLSHRAKKSIYHSRDTKVGALGPSPVFGIEAQRSLTKLQIAAWLTKVAPSLLRQAQFKVLPMNLLLRGLDAGEIDGFVAPSPWGLLAETLGSGSVDTCFAQGEFAQEVVLVCRRQTVKETPEAFQTLPKVLLNSRRRLKLAANFEATATAMSRHGGLNLGLDLLKKAAAKHWAKEPSPDFVPDTSCLLRMLRRSEEITPLKPSLGDLVKLARDLVL